MLSKLINFFGGSAAVLPPFRQQLYVAGAAYLGPDENIRTYSTTFEVPRPTPNMMPFPEFSAAVPEQAKPDELQSGFVRREAIFSHQSQCAIGHELMLNNSSELLGTSTSPMLRRMHDELLLKSILTLDSLQHPGDELVFIRLSPDSLGLDLIPQLPSRKVVLAFRPELETADKLITRCRELRTHGFRFALDDFIYSPGFYPLLGLADYVRFDIGRNSILELGPQLEQIPRLAEKTLIAKNVHSVETQKIASRLSFRHYQGSHFDRSASGAEPSISRQRAKIIVLMNMLRNQTESSEIEDAMRQDAPLSCQLLRYLNSPVNGLAQEMGSVTDALQTLGHDTLYRWLAVLLFCQENPEQSPGYSHNHTLLENALLRGRLTELFGQHNRSATEKTELFVAGMFSQLDLLFKMPLELVLNHLSLSAPVGQALLAQDGPYALPLKLAIACENHDQPSIEHHAQIANISIEQVNTTYVKALVWAHEIEN